MSKILDFLNARLVADWRLAMRLWSIRTAIFWGAVSGLFVAWPSLASVVPLPIFAAGSMLMSAALAVVRLLKQGDEP